MADAALRLEDYQAVADRGDCGVWRRIRADFYAPISSSWAGWPPCNWTATKRRLAACRTQSLATRTP